MQFKSTYKNNENNSQKYVLNLSKYKVNHHEYSVLSKGLKFIPTPQNGNIKKVILNDFDEFARKLRCKYHFDKGENLPIHPFKKPSGYNPPFTCYALEDYIDKTKLELSSIPIKKIHNNTSKLEREALTSLRNNNNIVIKKADKSNTIVIMDKDQYIAEAMRQLKSKHYMQVDKPDLHNLHHIIQNRVTQMYSKGSIDKETYRYLCDNKPSLKCGHLYLLPKIHKIKDEVRYALQNGQCSIRQLPPGRPIISQCDTPTRKIGAYCDYFLIPIVQNQSTYIKDTADFINKIETLELPAEVLLITYDVTSMYTNMEFGELLSAVNETYKNANKPQIDIPYPETEDLIFLLKCVLENNYFEFNGKYFKQIIGCSMGAIPSPEISDTRMYQITNYIMSKFKFANRVLYHGRFRDDGFIAFNGTQNEILQFFDIGNTCHEHLKFTYEISEKSVNFLDTTIYKGIRFQENNILDIKSYVKPTNNFQYLHRKSTHSPSVFKGFIKGECIRHTRNTSDPCILSTILTDFKTHLSKRGYSDKEIDPIIRTMENTNRKKFLVKTDLKCKQRQPNVMITKYNPHFKGLKKRILKYWNVLKNDEICKELFTKEPIIAYSKHKNIGEMIIQSRLQ